MNAKIVALLNAIGRFLRGNWLRIVLGGLVIFTSIFAWKEMLVLAVLTALFAVYFHTVTKDAHLYIKKNDDGEPRVGKDEDSLN